MKTWKYLELEEFRGLDLRTSPTNMPPHLSPYLCNVSLDIYGDISGRSPYSLYRPDTLYYNITSMERFYTKDGGKHLIVVERLHGQTHVYAHPYDGPRINIYEQALNQDGHFTFATWRNKIYFSSLEDGIRYWEPSMDYSESVYPDVEAGDSFHVETTADPLTLTQKSVTNLNNQLGITPPAWYEKEFNPDFDRPGDNIYGRIAGLSGIDIYGDTFFVNWQGYGSPGDENVAAVLSGSLSSGDVSSLYYNYYEATGNDVMLKNALDIAFNPHQQKIYQVQKTEGDSAHWANSRKRRWVEISIGELGHNIWGGTTGHEYYDGDAGGDCRNILYDGNDLIVTRYDGTNLYPYPWSSGHYEPDSPFGSAPLGATDSHWMYSTWDSHLDVIWAVVSGFSVGDPPQLAMISSDNEEIFKVDLPDGIKNEEIRGIAYKLVDYNPSLFFLIRRGNNEYEVWEYQVSGGTVGDSPDWTLDWFEEAGLGSWFGSNDRFKAIIPQGADAASLVVSEEIGTQANIDVKSSFRIERFGDITLHTDKGVALIVRQRDYQAFGVFYNLRDNRVRLIKTHIGMETIEYDTLAEQSFNVDEGADFNMRISIEENEIKGKIWTGTEPSAWNLEEETDDLMRPGYAGVAVFGQNIQVSFKDLIGDWTPLLTAITIAKGKYITLHNNRLFVANTEYDDERNPSDIRYSELGDHSKWYREEANIPIANTIKVSSQDGDEIKGLVPLMGELFVLKGNSVWILYGSGPHNFELKKIMPSLGCIAPKTVATYQNKIIFLSHQGIVMLDEGGVQIISELIEPALQNIPQNSLSHCVGGMKDNQYWFSFPRPIDVPYEPPVEEHVGTGSVSISVGGGITVFDGAAHEMVEIVVISGGGGITIFDGEVHDIIETVAISSGGGITISDGVAYETAETVAISGGGGIGIYDEVNIPEETEETASVAISGGGSIELTDGVTLDVTESVIISGGGGIELTDDVALDVTESVIISVGGGIELTDGAAYEPAPCVVVISAGGGIEIEDS